MSFYLNLQQNKTCLQSNAEQKTTEMKYLIMKTNFNTNVHMLIHIWKVTGLYICFQKLYTETAYVLKVECTQNFQHSECMQKNYLPFFIFNSANSMVALASSMLSCPFPDCCISLERNLLARNRRAVLWDPWGCLYNTAVSMTKSWDIFNANKSFSRECPTRTVSLYTNFRNSSWKWEATEISKTNSFNLNGSQLYKQFELINWNKTEQIKTTQGTEPECLSDLLSPHLTSQVLFH